MQSEKTSFHAKGREYLKKAEAAEKRKYVRTTGKRTHWLYDIVQEIRSLFFGRTYKDVDDKLF